MKKIFALVLAAIMSCGAYAEGFSSSDNEAHFGVRASIDITNLRQKVSAGGDKWGSNAGSAGLTAGVVYNYPIIANLYVEPGISLYYNTTKMRYTVPGSNLKDLYQMFGMKIPVIAGYHYDLDSPIKIHLFTGPVFNCAFSGDVKEDFYIINTQKVGQNKYKMFDKNNDYQYSGIYHRCSLDWRLGIGVQYDRYMFSISSDFGATDRSSGSGFSSHFTTTQFTLGYNF